MLQNGKRVESSVYTGDNSVRKNKAIMQLKRNVTLCGFGVRNIKYKVYFVS